MGSGGKGGSGSNAYKSYNYYGTIAVMIRAGPTDTLDSILIDEKAIWEGPVNRTDTGMTNPYYLTLTDGTLLAAGGYVAWYWGDPDQTVADAALPNHPPYRGQSYLVLKNFLFGLERTQAPNIEVVAEAKARPPAAVISDPDYDGDSVNPWACLAEILTSMNGCGLPASRLDAASWQACHDWFALEASYRLLTYCAALLDSQFQLSQLVTDLLSLCDGWLRDKGDGSLEAGYYWVDPGDLDQYTVLTANDFTKPLEYKTQTWDDVPTGVVVGFRDWVRMFADSAAPASGLVARLAGQEPREDSIDLTQYVIRDKQARRIAAEYVKRKCTLCGSGTAEVRPERAVNPDGSPLRPGCRFLMDIDPEPGGDGLLQLCRVTSRKFKPTTGPVTIEFTVEPNQPAVPYTPDWTPGAPEEYEVAEITQGLIMPVPLQLSGYEPAVSLLVARADDLTVGAKALFDVEGGSGTFTNIGVQKGFAVQCSLAADYAADSADPIRVQIVDTRDQALAMAQPGLSGATNDELLLAVVEMDGDYIKEDADGWPYLEWFSVQSSALVAGTTFDFTCLRGRRGSVARAWTTGDAVWIIPGNSLAVLKHQNFQQFVDAEANLVFRIDPFSAFAAYAGAYANFPFRFPGVFRHTPEFTWTTPAHPDTPVRLPLNSGPPVKGYMTPHFSITDRDRNLTRVTMYLTNEATGAQTIHECVFPPTGAMSYGQMTDLLGWDSGEITLGGRNDVDTHWGLMVRAMDAQGLQRDVALSLIVPPINGAAGGPTPPTLTYVNPIAIGATTVQLTIAAPAVYVHYAWQGPPTLTPPTAWTAAASGVEVTTRVTIVRRLWYRSSTEPDATGVASAWLFKDLAAEFYGGGYIR